MQFVICYKKLFCSNALLEPGYLNFKLSIALLAPIIDYGISRVTHYSFFNIKGLYLHESKVSLNLLPFFVYICKFVLAILWLCIYLVLRIV